MRLRLIIMMSIGILAAFMPMVFVYAAPSTSFTLTISDTSTPPLPPPPGGGGGGIGGGGASGASATFYGKASPFARIALLKDAQNVSNTIAGQTADFSISVAGLSPGEYTFELIAVDQAGVQSAPYTVHASVQASSNHLISNIVIAPTVTLDTTTVTPGQTFTARGQSAPGAQIIGYVDDASSSPAFRVVADAQGRWQGGVATRSTDSGTHTLKVIAITGGVQSPPSRAIAFGIGSAPPPEDEGIDPDFNHDGHVDIIDFSMLAYWYQRQNAPRRFDLNRDGKIDIRDFSIEAFYWTG